MDYNVSYRKKDGSIQCTIRYKDHSGKWRSKSKQGFKTQKASKPWQSKMINKLGEEIKSASKINDEFAGITYKEFMELYLEDVRLSSEYNTYTNKVDGLSKFDELSSKEMTKITFIDIKNAINDLIKKEYKFNSIRSYVSIIRTFFNVAEIDYEIIERNPMAGKRIKIPKDGKENSVKSLTRSKLSELLSLVSPEKDYLITSIAGMCGLRVGEIIGLTWDSIDKKGSNLIVDKQWKEKEEGVWGFGSVKNNISRSVPIPPELLKNLLRYEKTCVKSYDNRIFPDNRTNGTCRRVNTKYKRLGFDISIHDLRHTYATLLLANGMDIKTVSEFMGDTVDVIIKTYIHFDDDMYEAGRNKVNEIF